MFALMYRNKLMGKISNSLSLIKNCPFYFTKIVLHIFNRNDCGVFVVKYMEHWNGVVLTNVIDLVCYISKVLNLYALILG